MLMASGKRRLKLVRDKKPETEIVINGNDLRSGNIPSAYGQMLEGEQDHNLHHVKPRIAPDDNVYRIDANYEAEDY